MSSYTNNQPAEKITPAQQELNRVSAQLVTLMEAIEDVLSVFRSGAPADLKLMRIEDLLGSAVSDALDITN